MPPNVTSPTAGATQLVAGLGTDAQPRQRDVSTKWRTPRRASPSSSCSKDEGKGPDLAGAVPRVDEGFSFVLRAVLANAPNSIPPERVFSILNDTFDDDQDGPLTFRLH